MSVQSLASALDAATAQSLALGNALTPADYNFFMAEAIEPEVAAIGTQGIQGVQGPAAGPQERKAYKAFRGLKVLKVFKGFKVFKAFRDFTPIFLGLLGLVALLVQGTAARRATALSVGFGIKTLTTEPGLAYALECTFSFFLVNPTIWMQGTIVSYSDVTGVMVVNITLYSGSGTIA